MRRTIPTVVFLMISSKFNAGSSDYEQDYWDSEDSSDEQHPMISSKFNAGSSDYEQNYWDSEDSSDEQYPMITSNLTLNFRPNMSAGHSGCLLWDTSRELADYLERSCIENNWVREKRVLELGAGLGCAGITAACLGGNVTVTDLPVILPCLEDSINRNLQNIKGTGGEIRAEILRWGDKKKIKSMHSHDIILMSDVIYDEDTVHPLISTLVRLSHENTTLLMCQQRWIEIEGSVKWVVWKTFYHHASKFFKFSELRAKGRFVQDPGNVWLLKGKVLRIS